MMLFQKLKVQTLKAKPMLLMVVVQMTFGWVNVFFRLAQFDGMNLKVVIAYRFIFATGFLVPLAIIFEREGIQKIDKKVIFQAFWCSLFGGAISQNLYLEGLALTNATFASAMTNLIPGVTFVMAALLRMETLGMMKVLGTLVGIGGAMILTFYKGVLLDIFPTHVNLLTKIHKTNKAVSIHTNWVVGSALSFLNCIAFAAWMIVQTKMIKRYPYPYTATALMTLFAAVFSTLFVLCFSRRVDEWVLGLNIRLATVAYAGIVCSGISFTLMTWCMKVRGPVFTASFYPLMLIICAIAGALLLDERLHLGSALGSLLIICGLYMVLWGKGKELKTEVQTILCADGEKIIDKEEKNADNDERIDYKDIPSLEIKCDNLGMNDI